MKETGITLMPSQCAWLIVFIISLTTGYFIFIWGEAQTWEDQPLKSTIETMTYPVKNIDFPTITVCQKYNPPDTNGFVDSFHLIFLILDSFKFDNCLPKEINCPQNETNSLRNMLKLFLETVEPNMKKGFNNEEGFGPYAFIIHGDMVNTDYDQFDAITMLILNYDLKPFMDLINGVVNSSSLANSEFDVWKETKNRADQFNTSQEDIEWASRDHTEDILYTLSRLSTAEQYLESSKFSLGSTLRAIGTSIYQFDPESSIAIRDKKREIEMQELFRYILNHILDKQLTSKEGLLPYLSELSNVVSPVLPLNKKIKQIGYPILPVECTPTHFVNYREAWHNFVLESANSTHPCEKDHVKACCKGTAKAVGQDMTGLLKIMKYATPFCQDISSPLSLFEDLPQLNNLPFAKRQTDAHKSIINTLIPQYGFASQKHDHQTHLQSSITDVGICCSYNGLPVSKLYQDSKYTRSLREAHSALHQNVDPILNKIIGVGAGYKMSMVLDSKASRIMESNKGIFRKVESTFFISVSDSLQVHNMMSSGFEVLAGMETSVQISISQFVSDISIQELPISVRKCRFSFESHGLALLNNYTQSGCELECRIDIASKKCKCIPYNYPRSDYVQADTCDSYGAHCFVTVMANLTDLDICNCPADCNEIRYTRSLHTMAINEHRFCEFNGFDNFPTPPFMQEEKDAILLDIIYHIGTDREEKLKFNNRIHECFIRVKMDMALVHFEIDSPKVTRAVQNFRVTRPQKIAFVGGTVGFFTGASLMTFFEMALWIFKVGKVLCCWIWAKMEPKKLPRKI